MIFIGPLKYRRNSYEESSVAFDSKLFIAFTFLAKEVALPDVDLVTITVLSFVFFLEDFALDFFTSAIF